MRRGPSYTAGYVCWARALEARNPPETRVLWDPYAYDFLGFFGRCFYWLVAATGPLGRWLVARIPNFNQYIVARHRVMDDWIRAVSPRQLVILGAGYDMRALRLDIAELVAVFEVDHPLTAARKRQLIDGLDPVSRDMDIPRPARPRIEYISVDFQRDKLSERLAASSFDPSVPTAWVWEGVSMYLSESEVQHTLAEIREISAPGSTLTLDLAFEPGRGSLRLAIMGLFRQVVGWLGEPWGLDLHPREFEDWITPQGYRVEEIYTLSRLNSEVLAGRGGAIGSLYIACLRIMENEERQG
jgi:methyltransferase (TIGR00027 family)